MAEWLEVVPEEIRPPLVKLGGYDNKLILNDDAHTLFQGLVGDWTGSAINVLCAAKFYSGGNMDANVEGFNAALSEFAVPFGQGQLPYLTAQKLGMAADIANNKKPPYLPWGKCAHVKIAMYFTVHEVYHFHQQHRDDPVAYLMACTAWGIGTYQRTIDKADVLIMSDEHKDLAYRAGKCFLKAHELLRHLAVDDDLLLWRERPKHHQWDHSLDFMKETGINPNAQAVYMDEDWMGKLRDSTAMGHGSTGAAITGMRRYVDKTAELIHSSYMQHNEPLPEPRKARNVCST